jgi:hypothetical protein
LQSPHDLGRFAEEELLFEYLRLLEHRTQDRRVLHLALSRLSQLNRRPHHLQMAKEGFNRLARNDKGQLFQLVNGDLLFGYETLAETNVASELHRLRMLFGDDPIMRDPARAARFAVTYDATRQYADVVTVVRSIVASTANQAATRPFPPSAIREQLRARQRATRPMPPSLLPRLETALAQSDLSNFVRRQAVCKLAKETPPQSVFTQLMLSLPDLALAIVPDFDVTSDRFLARYLAEMLDRRMLAMLVRPDPHGPSGATGFAISIETLLSAAFEQFDSRLFVARRGAIVLEIPLTDIFEDVERARFACRLAQRKGYRVCLAGLSCDTLPLVNLRSLGVDFARVAFSPALLDASEGPSVLATAAAGAAPVRLILAGIDSRESALAAMAAGVELFQGRYPDLVLRDQDRRGALAAPAPQRRSR